jgi:hypothetical protein
VLGCLERAGPTSRCSDPILFTGAADHSVAGPPTHIQIEPGKAARSFLDPYVTAAQIRDKPDGLGDPEDACRQPRRNLQT